MTSSRQKLRPTETRRGTPMTRTTSSHHGKTGSPVYIAGAKRLRSKYHTNETCWALKRSTDVGCLQECEVCRRSNNEKVD
eukprot:2269028-Lingulodinium_polyedra.AAC.1